MQNQSTKKAKKVSVYDGKLVTLCWQTFYFDYLLVDSWFTCTELLQFIHRRKGKKHLLGMAKNGTTKYNCEFGVVKAATIDSINLLDRLKRLKGKFKDVVIYNGYSHSDFTEIMEDVNIGIVSPLWEDNLPQVAIEMIANGIPVMTSMNGGVHELNDYPLFRFYDEKEFITNLDTIIENRQILSEYWNYAQKLTTIESHIEKLFKIYDFQHLTKSTGTDIHISLGR